MNCEVFFPHSRMMLAAAVAVACSNASALTTLPEFTWNPAAIGLTGTSFTADNIIVSDFATVTFTPGNAFHEDGHLAVSSFQLDGKDIVAGGLNGTYSLYFHFTGDGVVNGPIAALTYELFGTNSVPAFGPGGTISGAVAPMQLAAGSLIAGSTGAINGQQGAGVAVTFHVSSAPFFAAPSAPNFYSVALSSFINAEGTVTSTANGFMVDNGGGSLHFAAPIPEPKAYVLLLAGLGALAFVARRRKPG